MASSASGAKYFRWQVRHGVQRASTVVAGQLAFAAAHFDAPLPQAETLVLAARDGKLLRPARAAMVKDTALLRLFEV